MKLVVEDRGFGEALRQNGRDLRDEVPFLPRKGEHDAKAFGAHTLSPEGLSCSVCGCPQWWTVASGMADALKAPHLHKAPPYALGAYEGALHAMLADEEILYPR